VFIIINSNRLDSIAGSLLWMATVFQWSTAWILWRPVMWLLKNRVCHT